MNKKATGLQILECSRVDLWNKVEHLEKELELTKAQIRSIDRSIETLERALKPTIICKPSRLHKGEIPSLESRLLALKKKQKAKTTGLSGASEDELMAELMKRKKGEKG
jgi:hypothetical protein